MAQLGLPHSAPVSCTRITSPSAERCSFDVEYAGTGRGRISSAFVGRAHQPRFNCGGCDVRIVREHQRRCARDHASGHAGARELKIARTVAFAELLPIRGPVQVAIVVAVGTVRKIVRKNAAIGALRLGHGATAICTIERNLQIVDADFGRVTATLAGLRNNKANTSFSAGIGRDVERLCPVFGPLVEAISSQGCPAIARIRGNLYRHGSADPVVRVNVAQSCIADVGEVGFPNHRGVGYASFYLQAIATEAQSTIVVDFKITSIRAVVFTQLPPAGRPILRAVVVAKRDIAELVTVAFDVAVGTFARWRAVEFAGRSEPLGRKESHPPAQDHRRSAVPVLPESLRPAAGRRLLITPVAHFADSKQEPGHLVRERLDH